MKTPARLCPVAALVLALVLLGCRKEPPADASQMLERSFATAPPEVKQSIDSVSANLKARNYAEVTRALTPVVARQQLSDEQKQAVSVTLVHINQAIAADPSLDSKEMYEMRAKMFEALRRGSRF